MPNARGLPCPKCSGATAVLDSRDRGDRITRRRLCINKSCGWRFNTIERIEHAPNRYIPAKNRLVDFQI